VQLGVAAAPADEEGRDVETDDRHGRSNAMTALKREFTATLEKSSSAPAAW
jgi:hypothetical protein